MTDLDPRAFLAGLTPEQQAQFAAAFFQEAPDAVTAHLAASPAAQALAATVVKPKRKSQRGPSFWDKVFADEGVIAGIATHLGLEEGATSFEVFAGLQARMERPSITGTFDRKDAEGRVHKMRMVLIDETGKSTASIQGKIEDIATASDTKALTAAVEAALKAVTKARALPETESAELTTEINAAKASREAQLTDAATPPEAPPAAELPADVPPAPPA